MRFIEKIKKLNSNKYISLLVKVTITILFFITVNRKIEFSRLIELFSTIKIYAIFPVIIFGFLNILFHVGRWHLLLQTSKISDSKRVAWITILWGTLLAFITPGRVGELFRGNGIIASDSKKMFFSVLIDKIFTIVVLLIFGVVSFFIKELFYKSYVTNVEFYFIVSLIAISIIVPFVIRLAPKIKFLRGVYNLLSDYKYLSVQDKWRVTLFSIAEYIALIAETVLLFRALGILNLKDCALSVLTAYAVMPFISVSIGGMGVREGSFAFFMNATAQYDVNQIATASLGASLIILVVNLLIPSIIGGVWFWIEKKEV